MYLTFFKNHETRHLDNTNYSLDDLFNGVNYYETNSILEPIERTNFETKTVETETVPAYTSVETLNNILQELQTLASYHNIEVINNEYKTFYIPKKSGGNREINAPEYELMMHLRNMKDILQYKLKVLTHNAAHAYVPHRSIVTALTVHKNKRSRWFLKLDIKDFFPSCSQEFVVKTLRKLYPFALWTEAQINSFIWICFRNDGLPQGTPMSPLLTNLIMIPIDEAIQKYAFENNLVYTRYADDILISGFNKWDWKKTEEALEEILTDTPFKINTEKTRFGSNAGRNWNLGLMLNKDNNITVGYKNKKRYKAMLNNLLTAEANDTPWSIEELYHFQGLTAYYTSIEPQYFTNLIKKYEETFNITLKEIYKLRL